MTCFQSNSSVLISDINKSKKYIKKKVILKNKRISVVLVFLMIAWSEIIEISFVKKEEPGKMLIQMRKEKILKTSKKIKKFKV